MHIYGWKQIVKICGRLTTTFSKCELVYVSSPKGFITVSCAQAHREGRGTGDTSSGPPSFKGANEALILTSWATSSRSLILYLSLFGDCLDSVSERWGRIISNAFTVSVDKLFNTIDHNVFFADKWFCNPFFFLVFTVE